MKLKCFRFLHSFLRVCLSTKKKYVVNDAIKQQRKDKPPVRPSSAVRKSTTSSNNNTPTGKSTPAADTQKRADRRVPAKKVRLH